MNLLQSLGSLNLLNTLQALSNLTMNSWLHQLTVYSLAGLPPGHGAPYYRWWGGPPGSPPEPPLEPPGPANPGPGGAQGPPPATGALPGPRAGPLAAGAAAFPPPFPSPPPQGPSLLLSPTAIAWEPPPRFHHRPDRPSHRRVYQTGEVRYFYADH